jgi:O-antigen ligase
MISKSEKSILSWLVLIAGLGTGLFITPSISTDPINVPKLTLLIFLGFSIIGLLIFNTKGLLTNVNRTFLILLSLFLLQITLVLLIVDSPFTQQFYGTNGRNTGYLAYASLIFIALGASVAASDNLVKNFSYSLIAFGAICAVYGILQATGNDPVKWNNPYNSVITFLGNPNFASSALGMSAVVAFAFFLNNNKNRLLQLLLSVQIFSSILLTFKSNSQQGFLVFAAGSAIVLGIYIRSHSKLSKKPIFLSYLGILSFFGVLTILGMLNQGPLGSFLYKTSVRQRGFYWNSAKEMMLSHPIFGVGLDSYGDWYLAKRSANAAFYSPDTQSNSAHNIFLDLGSTGGFPLFLINIALSVLTVIAIYKLVKRLTQFNWAFAAISGAWVAYEAQALISINQLGLGIWGWILMGLIIGYEFSTRPAPLNESKEIPKSKFKQGRSANNQKINLSRTFGGLGLGALIGLVIAIPIFQNDAIFRKAVSGQDAEVAIKAALANPEDLNRTIQIADRLQVSGLNQQAESLISHVLKENPRSITAWRIRLKLVEPGSAAFEEAKKQINYLNPRILLK